MSKATHANPTDQEAKHIICSQPLPLGVRRSAWWLYRHELERTNPKTGRSYTSRRALINVLAWMDEQSLLIQLLKQRPTPMQMTLLQMLADGMSQKQIAYELNKNYYTMALHFSNLRKRLGVETVYQAVAVAAKRGWVRVKSGRKDKS